MDSTAPLQDAQTRQRVPRWMRFWALFNVAAAAAVLFMSQPIWTPRSSYGKSYMGGPGDGFLFALVVLLPSAFFVLLNLAVLPSMLASSLRGKRWTHVWIWLAVVATWMASLTLMQFMMSRGTRIGS